MMKDHRSAHSWVNRNGQGRTAWPRLAVLLLTLAASVAAQRVRGSFVSAAGVYSEINYVDGTLAIWGVSGGVEGSRWATCVDVKDGATRWKRPLTNHLSGGVKTGPKTFAMLEGGVLSVRDLESGNAIWSTNASAIRRQLAFNRKWFDGEITSHELSTNNFYGTSPDDWQITSDFVRCRLIGAGPDKLVVFRESRGDMWLRKDYGVDWLLFDSASGKMEAGAEGRFVGASGKGVVAERDLHRYLILDGRVSRWPFDYAGPGAIVFVDERESRSLVRQDRLGVPRVLDGDARSVRTLPQLSGLGGRWVRSSTNLIRIYSVFDASAIASEQVSHRAEGRSLSGKLEWEAAWPAAIEKNEIEFSWVGQSANGHYFSRFSEVVRVSTGKPVAERIVSAAGNPEVDSSKWSNFRLSDDGSVLLEARGNDHWSGSSTIPTNYVTQLIGRDAVTGKVLWTKSETVKVKRPRP